MQQAYALVFEIKCTLFRCSFRLFCLPSQQMVYLKKRSYLASETQFGLAEQLSGTNW